MHSALLLVVGLGLLATLAQGGGLAAGITDTSRSPHAKLKCLPLDAVRWTEGFWADRFRLCHRTMLPSMEKALHHPDNSACLDNFAVAAGTAEGKHRGTFWGDGDCYKFLEACAHVYAVTRDPKLDALMDRWIDVIAKAQDKDGYLCTQIQLTPKTRWSARHHHELYNMGHLLTAACIHTRATGKDTFVRVATKLADYLYKVFQPRPPRLAAFGWNPSNIMGLVELYRTTRDERYLELAGIFVDMRGTTPSPADDRSPGDQNQNRVPLRKETTPVGHAVTAAYLYCGAADVVAETGEKALADALDRIWSHMADRRMYITGAIGALHHGVSERGDKVHEAFGRDYELPNRTAYNETCANIGSAMWCWRMLALTGDARYADGMETVLYNSMLSAMSLDGTRFFYTNPLARAGKQMPLLSNDTPTRWFTHKCYCCPPSVARTLAKLGGWAYSRSDDGIWVHLYGGNVLRTTLADGTPLTLTQTTEYPWSGAVRLAVAPQQAAAFTLRLRIPAWATGATLTVNGKAVPAAIKPGTYVRIRRTWAAGDVVRLALPMKPRLVQAHPRVE
ncbi:glycoside hydrolase family 127 protein, partial [bacterium]|nr:glycoside hydrolase family 127 protein [bacterium]